jgi:aldehyde dehydrogenase (NAD+)
MQMNGSEIVTPVMPVDRAYIKGQFLSPHGNQLVDLVNPTNNKVIGKVTMEPKAIIS